MLGARRALMRTGSVYAGPQWSVKPRAGGNDHEPGAQPDVVLARAPQLAVDPQHGAHIPLGLRVRRDSSVASHRLRPGVVRGEREGPVFEFQVVPPEKVRGAQDVLPGVLRVDPDGL